MTRIFSALIVLFAILHASALNAANPGQLRFHDEEADTTRLTSLLVEAQQAHLPSAGDRVAWFAQHFIDTPYVAHTLESTDGEYLTINLDELDCTTFVETCLALARTIGEGRSSWRDYVYNLESLRYRGGAIDGYPSRLHYISDWIVDNTHRDAVKEVTATWPRVSYLVKTIDYMSQNRDRYPALADSTDFERVRSTEIGYRSHRFPYVKSLDLADRKSTALFRNGDVVAFVTKIDGLDVSHLGIVLTDPNGGEPRLLHASYAGERVMIDPLSLPQYLKRNRNLLGVRVIRLKEP